MPLPWLWARQQDLLDLFSLHFGLTACRLCGPRLHTPADTLFWITEYSWAASCLLASG